MKLSFLVPTFRTGMEALATIMHVCSLAGPNVEVIVRDNSGDPEKAAFLQKLQTEHCHIYLAPFCSLYVNLSEAAKLAKGEFVFNVADDDYVDPLVVDAILQKIVSISDDPTYVGIIGDFLLSGTKGTELLTPEPIDGADALTRYKQFVASSRNLLWAVHRRKDYMRYIDFIRDLPGEFSFHDMHFNLLMLMTGRYAKVERVIYYKNIIGSDDQTVDIHNKTLFFTRKGIDAITQYTLMLLYIVEGCKVVIGSKLVDVPMDQRTQIAGLWCSHWFIRHIEYCRDFPDVENPNEVARETMRICRKWAFSKKMVIDEVLADLVSLFALCNQEFAEQYSKFWAPLGKSEAA